MQYDFTALDGVKKLWSLRESSNHIIARVSNYNVTDDDFKSLASRNWLTDQVIYKILKRLKIHFFDQNLKRKVH